MWLSKIGGSILSSMDTWIGVSSRIGSKSVEDTGVKIYSKIRTESQSWGSGSHSYSSSILLKWNLPISQRFGISQVQDCVMKLNLG